MKTTMKMKQSMNQEQFSYMIELLVIYKQMNPKKEVYITETGMKEAVQWYQKSMANMNIDPETIDELKRSMKS
jgi:hypothetical protein